MKIAKESHGRKIGYGPIAAILVTLGAFFGSQIIVIALLTITPLFTGWSADDINYALDSSVLAQFLSVFVVEALVLWFLWRFMRLRKVGWRDIGLVRPKLTDVGYAAIGYVTYFILLIMVNVFAQSLIPGLDFEQEQELMFSRETTGVALALIFTSLVVLPPLTEEITMRGFLYTGLRSKLSLVWTTVIVSLLFGAAHLQLGTGNNPLWVAAIDTTLMSVILVYLREKTGSLWPPMLIHAFKNLLAFSLIFIFKVI